MCHAVVEYMVYCAVLLSSGHVCVVAQCRGLVSHRDTVYTQWCNLTVTCHSRCDTVWRLRYCIGGTLVVVTCYSVL